MSHPELPPLPTEKTLESLAEYLKDMHEYDKAVKAYMETFHAEFISFAQSRGPNKPLPPLSSKWPLLPKPLPKSLPNEFGFVGLGGRPLPPPTKPHPPLPNHEFVGQPECQGGDLP